MRHLGDWNREYPPGYMRRRRAKAAAGSNDAPTVEDRDAKDWAALNLTASEARKAMLAAAQAARAAFTQQEETLERLREKLHRAEELLQARNTEIANLNAKVRYLEEQPPQLNGSVLSSIHDLLAMGLDSLALSDRAAEIGFRQTFGIRGDARCELPRPEKHRPLGAHSPPDPHGSFL
jgi:hypothetical protein